MRKIPEMRSNSNSYK